MNCKTRIPKWLIKGARTLLLRFWRGEVVRVLGDIISFVSGSPERSYYYTNAPGARDPFCSGPKIGYLKKYTCGVSIFGANFSRANFKLAYVLLHSQAFIQYVERFLLIPRGLLTKPIPSFHSMTILILVIQHLF